MAINNLVSRNLRLYGERVTSNPSLSNFLECIALMVVLWAPLFWWLQFIIRAHDKGLIFPFIICFIFVSSLTMLFVQRRHIEIREFSKFLFLVVAFGVLWPFVALSRLGRWMLGIVRSMYSRIFVVIGPRYRERSSAFETGCGARNMRLCATCEALVESSPLLIGTRWMFTRTVEKHIHHTARDLRNSGKQCHLCNFLLSSVKSLGYDDLGSGPATDNRSISPGALNSSMKLTVKLWQEQPYRRKPLLRLQVCDDGIRDPTPLVIEEVHEDLEVHKCIVPCATNSPKIMELARRWIESCRSHVLCQNIFIAPDQRSFRPTRLLEVEQSEIPKVRLVVTSEQPDLDPSKPIEYVALSHCWGNAIIKMLLSENLTAFKESVAFTKLPPNFQHAILVAIGIGVRYLWIDSLCIIQHCLEDWEIEAPRMGLVYANAVCTISPAASEDPYGGCFSSKGLFDNDCILRKQRESSLVVRTRFRNELALEELFDRKVESGPVTKRAWTFQERILSRRMIHFCKGFILFECNTLRASEYHEEGVPYLKRPNIRLDGKLHASAAIQRLHTEEDHYSKTTTSRIVEGLSTRPISRPAKSHVVHRTEVRYNQNYKSQEEKKEELFRISALSGMRGAFQLVVRSSGDELAERIEQYSTRNLTQHTDKLMAVAGVAYLIQAHANHQFLAGLWRNVLPFNLLWIRHETVSPTPRQSRDLPTWSWSSINGRISHRLKMSSTKSSKLPAKSSNMPLSETADEVFRTSWEHITPHITEEGIQILLIHNTLIHNAALNIYCALFDLNTSRVEFIPDVDINLSIETVFGIPVLSFKNARVEPVESDLQLHGIVVRAIPTQETSFERMGYFYTAKKDVAREVLGSVESKQSIWLV